MLDKPSLIKHILKINLSARVEWLQRFDAPALRLYLDHLQKTLEPRGGASYWVRHGDTAAAVTRRVA